VATVWATARHVLLAPEAGAAVAPVTRLDAHAHLVDELHDRADRSPRDSPATKTLRRAARANVRRTAGLETRETKRFRARGWRWSQVARDVLALSHGMISLAAMRYLGAIVAGFVGAAAGWLVTAALAAWIAGLYGMSDFEGERGMFAALFVGPIGGLVCMILAIWAVLRIGKGRAPLGATLGRVVLVVASIAAIVGAGIGLRLLTLHTYSN